MFRKQLKKLKNNYKKFKKSLSSTKYLSIGENCLADDILQRYDLKSYSSPWAAGRSNIEYVLQAEKDNYQSFLDKQYLYETKFGEKKVVRLNTYNEVKNIYESSLMNGFEFTHHDVLNNDELRNSFERRINRNLKLKGKTINFLYHHRLCADTKMDLLFKDLNELKHLYEERENKVNIYAFTQSIISTNEERRVEYQYIDGIHFYTFYTLQVWGGDNNDVLFARIDDDLISQMVKDLKSK